MWLDLRWCQLEYSNKVLGEQKVSPLLNHFSHSCKICPNVLTILISNPVGSVRYYLLNKLLRYSTFSERQLERIVLTALLKVSICAKSKRSEIGSSTVSRSISVPLIDWVIILFTMFLILTCKMRNQVFENCNSFCVSEAWGPINDLP